MFFCMTKDHNKYSLYIKGAYKIALDKRKNITRDTCESTCVCVLLELIVYDENSRLIVYSYYDNLLR